MIFSIGVDVVSVDRVANLWRNHSERLQQTVFTSEELLPLWIVRKGTLKLTENLSLGQRQYLATRFAAKEATIKAMRLPVDQSYELNNIEVLGKAHLTIRLSGALKEYLTKNGITQMKASCCCTKEEVASFVIGETTNGKSSDR